MATESLKLGRAWDDVFCDWTDALQLGRKGKKPARGPSAPSTWTGRPVASREPGTYPGQGSKADVRARLKAIARGGRQVMVKITPGKNRTLRAVRKHLQYIADDGQGVIYDQDGHAYRGTDEVEDLAWKWQHVGPKMPDEAATRLAFNIVFSMPDGTDERAVFDAVKATAEAEFGGHQWAMGQHFDEPHVHCHVSVKAEGMDGVRLNPRKADLQRWRERFAHELRERGVEAEATRRASRLHQQRINKPLAVTRLEDRGEPVSPAPAPEASRVEKWEGTRQKAVSSYDRIIDALDRSADAADRILARELMESVVGKAVRQAVDRDKRAKRGLERT